MASYLLFKILASEAEAIMKALIVQTVGIKWGVFKDRYSEKHSILVDAQHNRLTTDIIPQHDAVVKSSRETSIINVTLGTTPPVLSQLAERDQSGSKVYYEQSEVPRNRKILQQADPVQCRVG